MLPLACCCTYILKRHYYINRRACIIRTHINIYINKQIHLKNVPSRKVNLLPWRSTYDQSSFSIKLSPSKSAYLKNCCKWSPVIWSNCNCLQAVLKSLRESNLSLSTSKASNAWLHTTNTSTPIHTHSTKHIESPNSDLLARLHTSTFNISYTLNTHSDCILVVFWVLQR